MKKLLLAIIFSVFIGLKVSAQQAKLILPIGHTDKVNSISFSEDGKRFVIASDDHTARIWDTKTGLTLAVLTHKTGVTSASFSPDNKKIVTNTNDAVKIWDAQTGYMLFNLKGIEGTVTNASFSPDSKKIITKSNHSDEENSNTILITTSWNAQTGAMLAKSTKTSDINERFSIKMRRNGRFKILSPDGKIRLDFVEPSGLFNPRSAEIYDIKTGTLINPVVGGIKGVYRAGFSPDGKKIIVIPFQQDTAEICDGHTGKPLLTLKELHKHFFGEFYFSEDGKRVLTTIPDSTVEIWDVQTGELLININIKEDVGAASFTFDQKRMAVLGEKIAKIWDAQTGTLLFDLRKHSKEVTKASFTADGYNIIVWGDDTIKTWETQRYTPTGHNEAGLNFNVQRTNLSPNGKRLVTVCDCDTSVEIFDTRKGGSLFNLKLGLNTVNSSEVKSAFFTADSKKIITVLLYNIDQIQNSQIWRHVFGEGAPFAVGASISVNPVYIGSTTLPPVVVPPLRPDTIIRTTLPAQTRPTTVPPAPAVPTRSDDINKSLRPPETVPDHAFFSVITIWDATTGALLGSSKRDTNFIEKALLSPDETKIAAVLWDNTVKILDVQTDSTLVYLKGFDQNINTISFSPDSKKIVTSYSDNTARLWDAQTGALLAELKGHTNNVNSASFSPDGKNVLTSSDDNTCKIWSAATGKLLFTFLAIDNADYLVTDPYGRYDGSEGARKLLYLTCGTEVISLAKVKNQLWVPNLAEHIMNGDSIKAKKLSELDVCGFKAKVERK